MSLNEDLTAAFAASENTDSGQQTTESPVQQTEAPAPEDLSVPSSWKAEMRPHWEQLPTEVRKYVRSREDDFHKGIEQYKNDAANGKKWSEGLKEFIPYIESLGIEPLQGIRHLLTKEYTLRHGAPEAKQQIIAELQEAYGLTKKEATQVANAVQQQSGGSDPRFDDISQKLNALAQLVVHQSKQAELKAGLEAEAIALRAAQEEYGKVAGNPEYPHFETLRQDMADLLDAKLAKNLPEAYRKALAWHPELRDNGTQQGVVGSSKDGAAVSVKGAPKANSVKNLSAGASLRDVLSAAFGEVT